MKIKADVGFVFGRVSTKDQYNDKHFGVPVQIERLKTYASNFGIKIVGEFQFPESAFKGKRKKFKKALEHVFNYQEEAEKPVALLFYDEDRLTRKALSDVMVEIEKKREAGKIELHFQASNKVIHKGSSEGDILTFRIKCDVAEHESATKSRKVKDTILYKLRKGQFPGFAPTGLLNDSENKTLIHDPERAEGIKKMFNLYATGNFSGSELAKILRADKLTIKPTAGNKPRLIAKGDVIRLLNKRAFTGEFEWENPETGKQEIWKGNYEPLISIELYEKAQKVLKERAISFGVSKEKRQQYSSTKFYKYRGLLTCGFCGVTLTPKTTEYKGKEYVHYRCGHGRKSTQANWYEKKFGASGHSGVRNINGKVTINCPQKFWSEQEIDAELTRQFQALVANKKALKEIKEKLEVDFAERMTISEAQKKVLEAELKKQDELRKALVKKLVLEEHTKIALDIQEVLIETQDEIKRIKDKIGALEEEAEINVNEVTTVLTLCSDLDKQFPKLSPTNQRKLIMTAFKRITLWKGKVKGEKFNSADIAWTEPFQVLHEKWFDKAWKEDKKKGSGHGGFSGGKGIVQLNMRESDEVRRHCCIEHDFA